MVYAEMRLIDVQSLRPHEETDPVNFLIVSKKIHRDAFWHIPIIVDRDTGIIMDGHHRYQFALNSGFTVVPCYQMSYSSDLVKITHWKTGLPLSPQKIVEYVCAGKKFPPKTTRHVFNVMFDTVNIDFKKLYQPWAVINA